MVALSGVVALALVTMRVVGRRAARTVAQVNDILERSEARFRAMVRDSDDMMAIVDTSGRLVYASPATERILGFETDRLVGTSIFDLVHPEDQKAATAGLDLTRSGTVGERLEIRMRAVDHEWHLMEAVTTNLPRRSRHRGLRDQRT